jgi:hypothetical protein
MRPWRALAVVYYALSIFVILVPVYWWLVDVGGILTIMDSPFMISVSFLGQDLKIVNLINAGLTGFRLYLLIITAYGLFAVLKGKKFVDSTLFAVTVLYILEPILFFLIVKLLSALGYLPADYEPILFGTTQLVVTQQNTVAVLLVTFKPTEFYWFALLVAALYLLMRASLMIESRKEEKQT